MSISRGAKLDDRSGPSRSIELRAVSTGTHKVCSTAKPRASVPGLQVKLTDRLPPVSGVGLQLGADKLCYAVRAFDPHIAFGVPTDGADEPARQAVAVGVRGGNAVFQPDETAVHSTDPQCSGTTFVQREDAITPETRSTCQVENPETLAIKAREPPECAYPEVAVVVLQQCIHGVLRQSLLRLPDRGEVLRRI